MASAQEADSVTGLLELVRNGDAKAAQHLWDRYFHRMLGLAKHILRPSADNEVVASSAFRRFLTAISDGNYREVMDRTAVWVCLANLTKQRAFDERRQDLALKRGGGRVMNESHSKESPEDGGSYNLDTFPSPDLAPLERIINADLVARLLNALPDENLRGVALGKFENLTNRELAERMDCSLATVERRLQMIRKLWSRKVVDG